MNFDVILFDLFDWLDNDIFGGFNKVIFLLSILMGFLNDFFGNI